MKNKKRGNWAGKIDDYLHQEGMVKNIRFLQDYKITRRWKITCELSDINELQEGCLEFFFFFCQQ